MGEARRRQLAREAAYAEGRKWKEPDCCPACQSTRIGRSDILPDGMHEEMVRRKVSKRIPSARSPATIAPSIDAVAIGIWPSTGHEIIGIEIKVSRSDWLRELKEPAKAQELMRFCTRWYLACPAGLVKSDELPATWGMMTLANGGLMRSVVKAKLLSPEPLTVGFMSACLRNSNAVDMELISRMVEERVSAREKSFEETIEREVRRRQEDLGRRGKAAEKVAAIVKAITGRDLTDWDFDAPTLAATYLFLKRSGLHTNTTWGHGNVPSILRALDEASGALRAIFDDPLFQEIRSQIPSHDELAKIEAAA